MEAESERKRKHVVDHIVTGFKSAQDAIKFGNTVEHIISNKIGKFKFRQSVGSTETHMAITEDWVGDTALNMHFLELYRDQAIFIRDKVSELVNLSDEDIQLESELLRGKPQATLINLNYSRR